MTGLYTLSHKNKKAIDRIKKNIKGMYNYAQPCTLLLKKNNRAKKTAGSYYRGIGLHQQDKPCEAAAESLFMWLVKGCAGFIYPFAQKQKSIDRIKKYI